MSRSYRKAIYTDGQSGYRKSKKRLASKAVRRHMDIQSGGAYKKVFNSWDICDWKFDERFEPDTEIVRNWRTGELNEEITSVAKHRGSRRTKAGWIIPK